MTPQIQTILDLLVGDDFPYPVAIHEDHDFDMGPILAVDAFDLPDDATSPMHERLGEVLGPLETTPVLLPGFARDHESTVRRAALPAATVWYEPRRTHAQSR
jgi:hypothetical protein